MPAIAVCTVMNATCAAVAATPPRRLAFVRNLGRGRGGGPVRDPGRPVRHSDQMLTLTIAARRAQGAYPGPVGELLCREIDAYRDFGYNVDGSGLIPHIARDLLAAMEAA